MTHHNIAGSEAFDVGPHVNIRKAARRRRPASPAVRVHVLFAGIGLAAGVIDLVIGQPVALLVALAAVFAWRFWPAAR